MPRPDETVGAAEAALLASVTRRVRAERERDAWEWFAARGAELASSLAFERALERELRFRPMFPQRRREVILERKRAVYARVEP